MSSTAKNLFMFLVAIVVGWWVLRVVVGWAISLVLGVLIPVAVLGGVAYGAYVLFGRKALEGRRTRYLP